MFDIIFIWCWKRQRKEEQPNEVVIKQAKYEKAIKATIRKFREKRTNR